MEARKAVAVVNPRSQNGALGRQWGDLARVLRREFGPFEDALTSGPGDATALAAEALRGGADLVIAVGGDGTIHEVANGFFADGKPISPEASLGVIPFGTGGDFRKTIHLSTDAAEAARVLKSGSRRAIDVGLLEYAEGGRGGKRASRVFINIASFGIGGLVDRIVNTSSKALGGTVSFFLGTARAALVYRNQRVRMIFDGDEADFLEMPINNVAVANGQYFGGGMHIAPRAELDDGKLDVVILGDLGKLDLLRDGHRVYKGTHLELPKVRFRQATRLDASAVDPDAEVLLDVDGEAPGALPARFTLLPRALGLVVPGGPEA